MHRSYKHIYPCKPHFYQYISITPESSIVAFLSFWVLRNTYCPDFYHVLPFLELLGEEVKQCVCLCEGFSLGIILLLCLSVVCSFLLLSIIPLNEYNTVCSFFHLLMNTWAATSFWLLWIKLLWLSFIKDFLWIGVFIFLR